MVPTLPAAVFDAEVTMGGIISPVSLRRAEQARPLRPLKPRRSRRSRLGNWQWRGFVSVPGPLRGTRPTFERDDESRVMFVVVYRSGSCMIWDFCQTF